MTCRRHGRSSRRIPSQPNPIINLPYLYASDIRLEAAHIDRLISKPILNEGARNAYGTGQAPCGGLTDMRDQEMCGR